MFKVSGKYNCYLAFFTLYKFVLSNAVFLISLIPRDDNKFVILDISSSSLVITIFGPFYISDGSSESLYWLPIKTAWSKLFSQKSPPKITNFRTCPSLLCFLFTSGGGTQTRVFLLMCRTRLPPLRQQNKNKEKEAENGPFKKTTASPPTTTTASPTTTTTAGIAATLWHYPQWKDPKKFKFKILFCPENNFFRRRRCPHSSCFIFETPFFFRREWFHCPCSVCLSFESSFRETNHKRGDFTFARKADNQIW